MKKKYLSVFWLANCISLLTINIACAVAVLIACLTYQDYVLAVCQLLFTLVTVWIVVIRLPVIRYVVERNGHAIMYSYNKKVMGEVDLRENVFYEVLKINEGAIPVQQYAILSNFKFSSFGPVRKNGKNDIVIVIRAVEANRHCIMLPYNDPYTLGLLKRLNCCKVSYGDE